MNKFTNSILVALITVATIQANPQHPDSLPLESGSTYENPIIPGFNPDPSICRVGDDYYIVTSTFEFFPGVPVYHSKDLVNWKLIGHALSEPSQLNLDGLNDNGGIYAPSIRYHNGTFYMITTLLGVEKGDSRPYGNFVVTATNPAGPWSEPHWIRAPGIDPQLFFEDDGRVYYIGQRKPETVLWPKHRNIWVQEINPETWQWIGERVDVVTPEHDAEAGTKLSWLGNFEGAHLYKRNGVYYVLFSHGGTYWNHAVSIWKSDTILGPYKPNPDNPIITHRDYPRTAAIHSVGHADIVETQNGEWWMVLLGKRNFEDQKEIIGRESFMVPLNWEGEFPVVNPGPNAGRVEAVHRRPNLPVHRWPDIDPRDDFNDSKLSLEWNFLRTPRSTWWNLTSKPGFLQLQLRPEVLSDTVNPSFLGQRQKHLYFDASTHLVFHPKATGEAAGMVLYRGMNTYITFLYALHNGKPSLVVTSRSKTDDGGADKLLAAIPVDGKDLYLKISGNNIHYDFSYSEDGVLWKTVKEKVWGGILVQYSYTGVQVGLYATGTSTNRVASFDWFEYRPSTRTPVAEKKR